MLFNNVFIICPLVAATSLDYSNQQKSEGWRRFMSWQYKTSRRGFLGAAAALGTTALTGCATRAATSPERSAEGLPERGEFNIKSAHILTMEAR